MVPRGLTTISHPENRICYNLHGVYRLTKCKLRPCRFYPDFKEGKYFVIEFDSLQVIPREVDD